MLGGKIKGGFRKAHKDDPRLKHIIERAVKKDALSFALVSFVGAFFGSVLSWWIIGLLAIFVL